MPAPIDSNSRAANIKMSLDKYVYDNLSASEGLTINYEGVPFNDTSCDSWIQPRILNISSDYHRQGSGTQYGEYTNILYQINVFTKKSGITTSHAHYTIRDQVANYFRVKQNIDIKDYINSGTTQLDVLVVRDIVNDNPLSEDNEYYQYVMAWELDYTRLTTQA